MPIANYTTEVDAHKSMGEIIGFLVGAGASEIGTEYDAAKQPAAIKFRIDRPETTLSFRLPGDWRRTLKVLQSSRDVAPRYKTEDHAKRVAWRCVRDWVRAQLALVEIGCASLDQVMMSYVLLPDGETLYEKLLLTKFKALLPEKTNPSDVSE